MRQKTHSGLKKRVKVKKSGNVSIEKSCKNHLLSNKSKRQKKSYMCGMPVDSTRMQALRRLMPGTVGLKRVRVEGEAVAIVEKKPVKVARVAGVGAGAEKSTK